MGKVQIDAEALRGMRSRVGNIDAYIDLLLEYVEKAGEAATLATKERDVLKEVHLAAGRYRSACEDIPQDPDGSTRDERERDAYMNLMSAMGKYDGRYSCAKQEAQ